MDFLKRKKKTFSSSEIQSLSPLDLNLFNGQSLNSSQSLSSWQSIYFFEKKIEIFSNLKKINRFILLREFLN